MSIFQPRGLVAISSELAKSHPKYGISGAYVFLLIVVAIFTIISLFSQATWGSVIWGFCLYKMYKQSKDRIPLCVILFRVLPAAIFIFGFAYTLAAHFGLTTEPRLQSLAAEALFFGLIQCIITVPIALLVRSSVRFNLTTRSMVFADDDILKEKTS
jgi:hypothetical protein